MKKFKHITYVAVVNLFPPIQVFGELMSETFKSSKGKNRLKSVTDTVTTGRFSEVWYKHVVSRTYTGKSSSLHSSSQDREGNHVEGLE